MCGAGMEATILAHDQLIAGSREVMIAGGMESMTNAPYLLKKGVAATAWATTRSSTT
jgi:acetyl-CoA C-acetyltransferase